MARKTTRRRKVAAKRPAKGRKRTGTRKSTARARKYTGTPRKSTASGATTGPGDPQNHPQHGHGYIHLTVKNNVDVDTAAIACRTWAGTTGKLRAGESLHTISAMQDPFTRGKGDLVIILAHTADLPHSEAAHLRMMAIADKLQQEVPLNSNQKSFKPNPNHWCCWGDH